MQIILQSKIKNLEFILKSDDSTDQYYRWQKTNHLKKINSQAT